MTICICIYIIRANIWLWLLWILLKSITPTNKAHGCEEISVAMLQLCQTEVAIPFTKCIYTGMFPILESTSSLFIRMELANWNQSRDQFQGGSRVLKLNHIHSLIMRIINENCLKSVLMAAVDAAINIISFEKTNDHSVYEALISEMAEAKFKRSA